MTPLILLCQLLPLSIDAQPIDIPLRSEKLTSKKAFRISYNYSQPADSLAVLKGYKLPKGIKPTHAGTVYLIGKRVVYYGVQDKKRWQFSEIGFDFNRNKVFEKGEIARYSSADPVRKGNAVFAFAGNANPIAFVTAYRTVSVQLSPARQMVGSAAIGGKTLDFTLSDSNYDGKIDANDMICWVDRNVRTQTISALFAMPDGQYYTASLPSAKVLRFAPDTRPTGTVSVKGGKIEGVDVLFNGKRFGAAIKDGTLVLPEGSYDLNLVAFSATSANGTRYHLCFGGGSKLYKVVGGSELSLDPGPISRIDLRIGRGSKAVGFELSAYCKSGHAVFSVTIDDDNGGSRPPAPTVEIIDPSGQKVGEVTLKYG